MSFSAVAPIELLAAVAVASVLGSLHCVGMCGPFALWASGAGVARGGLLTRMTAYHLGRLLTYSVGGLLAGTAGAMLSAGGDLVGFQSASARIAGGVMIGLGLARGYGWIFTRLRARRAASANVGDTSLAGQSPSAASTSPASGGRVAGWLVTLRPTINRLPGPARAFAAGTLTTLLPCGWLYLFLLVAAGTGSVASSLAVMFAFWLGTLPALSSLMVGAFRFAPKVRPVLPLVGSGLLLVTGFYTATGRASADMRGLVDRAAEIRGEGETAGPEGVRETVDAISETPLPCCSSGE